ncbi:MAG: hypothetical protein QOK37_4429 [Thermoanaerobaculia bacterium]|jgi:hypothetical protein|nr:hypothetical protein [Thermoanaerobaculia bacterium]
MKPLIVFSMLLLSVAAPPAAMTVSPVPFPFGHKTSVPYVVADGSGGFAVSWFDRDAKALTFAHYDGAKWSKANVIARGSLLDNRADYPSIALAGRTLFAQWRESFGADGTKIRLARSSDGGVTWSKPVAPHPAIEREFGFVSMLPLVDGSARIVWLDGRASVHEGEGATQLRAATMTPSGTLADDALVDGRVCDCCQTALAMTSRGPLAVYRDRSDKEVRDIAIAAPQANAHSVSVHIDGWMMKGCPVNGPRIDARGTNVVVAWFSAADEKPAVNVAFSRDGGATFARPLRVDAGHPSGRVDVVLLDDGNSAVVSWVQRAGVGSHVMARRVTATGSLGAPQKLGSSTSIGFPRIARSKDSILAAWSGDDGIQLASINSRIR